MNWYPDGDLKIARGALGTYRISEWVIRGVSEFIVMLYKPKSRIGRTVGTFHSLESAKGAAKNFDDSRIRR